MNEWHSGTILLTTDPNRMSLDDIERFLRQSYWARKAMVGFTRVVTDAADFAWLCDVWIEPPYRRRGLADWMIGSVLTHPDLIGLRRTILATSSAHGLYERHGFVTLEQPQLWMERGPNPR